MKSYSGLLALMAGILAGWLWNTYYMSEELPAIAPKTEEITNEYDDHLYQYYAYEAYLTDKKRIKKVYNIDVESQNIIREKVQTNEFLNDILLSHHIPYQQVEAISRKASKVFNVNLLKAQQPYIILLGANDVVEYFIYDLNRTQYVVFDLQDGIHIYQKNKEVTIESQAVAGTIYSSASQTMASNGINPDLAIQLSEIFAHSIDFFRIQAGDQFKAIYQEKFVGTQSIGIQQVEAAYFRHRNKDYYAFAFEKETGKREYFDDIAKSVKKGFLKAPLKFSRISSRYSKSRYHPILRRRKPHLGTDYAAPRGTPVVTVGDGTIVKAGYGRGNGKFIKIKHNKTYQTQYLHLSKFARGIKKGRKVKQGDVIGYVGSTGLATGPHLCYRLWKNGKQVDPYKEEGAFTIPIDPKLVKRFTTQKDSLMRLMQATFYPIEVTE